MEKVMEKQSAMALSYKRCDAYLFSHFATEILPAFEPRDDSGMPCQYSSAACLILAHKCRKMRAACVSQNCSFLNPLHRVLSLMNVYVLASF